MGKCWMREFLMYQRRFFLGAQMAENQRRWSRAHFSGAEAAKARGVDAAVWASG